MKEGTLFDISLPIVATNFSGKETRLTEEGHRTICLDCCTAEDKHKYIHPRINAIMELYKKEADGSFTKLSDEFRRRLDRRSHTKIILTAKDSGEEFESYIYDEMCPVLDTVTFIEPLMDIEYKILETSLSLERLDCVTTYRLWRLKATVSDEDLNRIKESRA